jgi:hypothetical protein
VREIGREEEGVNVSDFFGMGVICDIFHWEGVIVMEAQRAKKECKEVRKCCDGHRAWSIRLCIVSRPKDLLVGYLEMARLMVVVERNARKVLVDGA